MNCRSPLDELFSQGLVFCSKFGKSLAMILGQSPVVALTPVIHHGALETGSSLRLRSPLNKQDLHTRQQKTLSEVTEGYFLRNCQFPKTNRLIAVVKTGIFKNILPMDWKKKNNLDTKSYLSSKLAIVYETTTRFRDAMLYSQWCIHRNSVRHNLFEKPLSIDTASEHDASTLFVMLITVKILHQYVNHHYIYCNSTRNIHTLRSRFSIMLAA